VTILTHKKAAFLGGGVPLGCKTPASHNFRLWIWGWFSYGTLACSWPRQPRLSWPVPVADSANWSLANPCGDEADKDSS